MNKLEKILKIINFISEIIYILLLRIGTISIIFIVIYYSEQVLIKYKFNNTYTFIILLGIFIILYKVGSIIEDYKKK